MKHYVTNFERKSRNNEQDELIFDLSHITMSKPKVSFMEGKASSLSAVENGKGRYLFDSQKPLAFHEAGSFAVSAKSERIVAVVSKAAGGMLSVECED